MAPPRPRTSPVGAPPTTTAGAPFSITVAALDQFNNVASGYRGTVHFTGSDNGAGSSIPADYTFGASDNGLHAFSGGTSSFLSRLATRRSRPPTPSAPVSSAPPPWR